uniref:Uncharacterized protein n=1 Tax=Ananas comosus var. bracteatus TaxID=296719 RepID=A0A6V7NS33_ANACO|nr:unnamed protein product [Ananas comosus var. bracteatus]
MGSSSTCRTSNANCRTTLLFNESQNAPKIRNSEASEDEIALHRDMGALSVSKRLTKSVSEKLKKKKKKKKNGRSGRTNEEGLQLNPKPESGFVQVPQSLYHGGGCRVNACEELDPNRSWRLSSLDDCMPHKMNNGSRKHRSNAPTLCASGFGRRI